MTNKNCFEINRLQIDEHSCDLGVRRDLDIVRHTFRHRLRHKFIEDNHADSTNSCCVHCDMCRSV